MTTSGEALYFNPWDQAFRANPYPYYKELVAGPPRLITLFIPVALVARYADVSEVLSDHQRFSSVMPPNPYSARRNALFGETARVVFSDPPVHTRLRRLVSPAFTPRRIEALKPRIQAIAGELLDRAAARGEFDLMADFANLLPVTVIAEMLGVPPEHHGRFKRWSDAVIEADNVLPSVPFPDDVVNAVADLRTYFREAIERRRREPRDDLVSLLVAARDEREALSEAELLAFVVLLLVAGNQTTTNLVGNGMLALVRNPEQLARLRADQTLLPAAIEEMLRYDGPVQSAVRYPTSDTVVGGCEIPSQTPTFVLVAAANRDPHRFATPDRFDITRSPNPHLAFGDAIHYCLGAALAHLEASIAISAVLARFSRLRLAEPEAPLSYRGSYFLRGLGSLRIAVD